MLPLLTFEFESKDLTINITLCVSTVRDGRQGFPEGAPYDAIHVGAAAPSVPKSVRKLLFWCLAQI